MQVDKGAIRFILSGANIMCPGLTSPGAKMTKVPEGTVVVSLGNDLQMPFFCNRDSFFSLSTIYLYMNKIFYRLNSTSLQIYIGIFKRINYCFSDEVQGPVPQ